MTIGIFGGSFDPIHIGHTRLATYIVRTRLVDEVLLMVSPLNPLKVDRPPVSFEDRYEMVRLATSELDEIYPSDFERSLPLPSFTFRTLHALAERYPDDRFRLIIGADNWKSFDRWRNPEEIIADFSPIIYPRPGIEIDPKNLPAGVDYLEDAPMTDISSTELRAILSDKKASRPDLIDPRVWAFARKIYSI